MSAATAMLLLHGMPMPGSTVRGLPPQMDREATAYKLDEVRQQLADACTASERAAADATAQRSAAEAAALAATAAQLADLRCQLERWFGQHCCVHAYFRREEAGPHMPHQQCTCCVLSYLQLDVLTAVIVIAVSAARRSHGCARSWTPRPGTTSACTQMSGR